jgi:hypothetical protein
MQDAIDKLIRLNLVEKKHDKYVARPLSDANKQLDRLWDAYFEF